MSAAGKKCVGGVIVRAIYVCTSSTDCSEVEKARGVGRQIGFFVESSDEKADQGIVRGRGAQCQSMPSGYILSHCFRECQSHDVWLMFVAVSHNQHKYFLSHSAMNAYAGPYGDL